MTQNTVNYTDNPTGPELLDEYLAKEQENVLSSNSGIQRPSYATAGTPWLDTSNTPWLYKMYDGSEDVVFGVINPVTHEFSDNNVTLDTDQIISGNKTFTQFTHYKTNIAYTETPSSNKYGGFNFVDKNDSEISAFYTALYSDGGGLSGFNLKNKSGNSTGLYLRYNASGTFYTEAPTPTDTTTTSGTQIATTGWVNSVGNNVVHLSDRETITGNKSFSGNVKLTETTDAPQKGLFISNDNTKYAISVQNTEVTKGTAPSEGVIFGVDFYGTKADDNKDRFGAIECVYDTNKSTSLAMVLYDATSAENTSNAKVQLFHNGTTGATYAIAPASDVGGSIVTTVSKTKASNGGFKLGNGEITQKGKAKFTSNTLTITFPIPFSNTNYSFVAIATDNRSGGYSYDAVNGVTSRTATSITIYSYYGNQNIDWIAIGY